MQPGRERRRRLKRIGRYLARGTVVDSEGGQWLCRLQRDTLEHQLLHNDARKNVLRCCESELMALVRGSVGLGSKAMAEDFGWKFGVDQETDSSAATGVATRRGVEEDTSLSGDVLDRILWIGFWRTSFFI